METTNAIFELYEEKKHSVRYNEVGEMGDKVKVAASIYFSKNLLDLPPWPEKIKITVEDVS